MGGPLTEARKRLSSLDDLEQAAALLNVPGLDDADRNTGAPPHRRQAALLARIADWAGLSARAAEELGELHFSDVPEPYAYLIETVDEHDGTWWNAGLDGSSGGIEDSPDSRRPGSHSRRRPAPRGQTHSSRQSGTGKTSSLPDTARGTTTQRPST